MDGSMIPAQPLEYWASVGRLDRVRAVLAEHPDVNAHGRDGYTALHAAAENGHIPVLRFLLQHGAEVNPYLLSGQTPLDLALTADRQDAAAVLRHHGATSGARDGGPSAV